MDVGRLRILVPVLGRPHRVQPTIDSAIAATPGLTLEQILFIPDDGDASEIRALEAAGANFMRRKGENYAQKINAAANWLWAMEGCPDCGDALLFFVGADDLDFKPGWLDAAIAEMSAEIFVVGVNDLIRRSGAKANHATHFLVRGDYLAEGTIDRPGHLLHQGYDHCFVDNEFIGTAKARSTYRYAADSHVEHLHPLAGKGTVDATYRRGMRCFSADQQIFKRREVMWASAD